MNKSIGVFLASLVLFLASCKIYSFKDTSIPPEVKTIHLAYIENKARLVSPQLSPQLDAAVRQKINNQASRLVQRPDADADYDVTAYVSDYSITTSGISNQQASMNRLNVTVHIIFKNHLDPTGKKVAPADFEADVTRNFDFPAAQTITDAEPALIPQMVQQLTDEIFNKLFSNW